MTAPRVDPDFAREVLRELYSYPPKRKGTAWFVWAALGWAGGHRFYLGRTGTGLLMLLTGGGMGVWWIVDAFLLNDMLRAHAEEQERRRIAGEPPLELAFMPPLATDVLEQPPPWTLKHDEHGTTRRSVRLAGDVLVLLIVGVVVGAVADAPGGEEAAFAATAVIGVTLLGGQVGWLDRVPLAGGLVRWSHRLRLFYYYNRPGSPPELLVRAFAGILLAPFRKRERAETRIYIQLGVGFTLLFLTIDVMQEVAGPLFDIGLAAVAPPRLLALWMREAFMTFLLIYAFVTPIGAVLTHHLLTRPTHTVPRVLGAVALASMVLGFAS